MKVVRVASQQLATEASEHQALPADRHIVLGPCRRRPRCGGMAKRHIVSRCGGGRRTPVSDQADEVRAELEEPELRRVETESRRELRDHRDRRVAGLCAHVQGHTLAIELRRVRRTVRLNGQQRQMQRQGIAKLRQHRVDGVVSLKRGDGRSQQLRDLAVDGRVPPFRGGAEANQRADERRSVTPPSGRA